ncbi:MAG: cyanophycinase [Phycisphaeraceae bacterium]
MTHRIPPRLFVVALLLALSSPLPGRAAAELPHPIKGSLVIHGGGKLPDSVVKEFVKLAGAAEAKLIIIPTAGLTKEEVEAEKYVKAWQARGFEHVTVLHTVSRDKAGEKAFVEPLTKATAVWFEGGQQSRLESTYVNTLVEEELYKVLDRGGVIGGSSAGAAIMSRTMIRQGNPAPEMGSGLGLMPGAIIDQHFNQRERKVRLLAALKEHPGLAGYGIDEGTALVLKSRFMRVVGEGNVTIILGASKTRPAREIVLKEGGYADLMAMHRAAIARAGDTFPPAELPVPKALGKGTLVIVGGGGTPAEALKAFIEEAGGVDAPLVIISNALGDEVPAERVGEVGMLKNAGAKNVKVIHAKSLEEAGSRAITKSLREAKGIWFSGGRQWRFVDAYENTPALKAIHEMLEAGGVIGGSSAGATIQGEYLVRGDPLGNTNMMAEGYERGFGFLTGVAIDQHFAQRKRFADLEDVKRTFPQLMCLGIDESTAIIVKGQTVRVVGKSNVYIYDRAKLEGGEANYTKLAAGEKYDLKAKKKVQ